MGLEGIVSKWLDSAPGGGFLLTQFSVFPGARSSNSNMASEKDEGGARLAETVSVSQVSRCGARTRSGAPCKSAPVTGRRRCRMHGGAAGSGAPSGSKNGNYKHGRYTAEVAATRLWLREAIQTLRELNKRP
jgi:hypothetical protein